MSMAGLTCLSCFSWRPSCPAGGHRLPRVRTRSWPPTLRRARAPVARGHDSSPAPGRSGTRPWRRSPGCAEPALAHPRDGRTRLGFRVGTSHRTATATDQQLVRVSEIRWPQGASSDKPRVPVFRDSPSEMLSTIRLSARAVRTLPASRGSKQGCWRVISLIAIIRTLR
jgi:hypothetical protein